MSTWAVAAPVAAVLLVLAHALLSVTLAAVAGAARGHVARLAKAGNRAAQRLSGLLDDRDETLASLATARVVALAAAGGAAAMSPYGWPVVVSVGALAAAVAIEPSARAAAVADPERFALRMNGLVHPVAVIFRPFVALGARLVGHRPRRLPEADSEAAHEELRETVDLLHKEGAVVKADRDMVGGVLDLARLTVADVMVHRTRMKALDADLPAAELVREALESPFTRLPVFRGQPDDIIGVVHAKDLLRALQRAGGKADRVDIAAIASDPWFVPETTRLDDQLRAFRKRKFHLALVVDEYGEVRGLITLEDILEEIVGEIADEQDVVAQGVRPQADGSVNVSGQVPIRDLNRVMDWRLPEGDAITVAGLVIHEARAIPDAGQAFTFHGFRFQVLRRQRNRITALRVTPLAAGERAERRHDSTSGR